MVKMGSISPRAENANDRDQPCHSFAVFICHLYYAPLKGKSGRTSCEFFVNNKRAGLNVNLDQLFYALNLNDVDGKIKAKNGVYNCRVARGK